MIAITVFVGLSGHILDPIILPPLYDIPGFT